MHTALRIRLAATGNTMFGFGQAATSSGAVHDGTCAFVRVSAQAS
jgi:hypothetical protein